MKRILTLIFLLACLRAESAMLMVTTNGLVIGPSNFLAQTFLNGSNTTWQLTNWTVGGQTVWAIRLHSAGSGTAGAVALGGLTDVEITSMADGDVLKWDAASSTWTNLPDSTATAGSGITTFNGLTNDPQTLAIGSSGTAPNWSSLTSTHTLNLPFASNHIHGIISSNNWVTLMGLSGEIASALAEAKAYADTNTIRGDVAAGSITLSNVTASRILATDAENIITNLPAGVAGQVLTSTGTGYQWSDATGGSGGGSTLVIQTNSVLVGTLQNLRLQTNGVLVGTL